MPDNHDNSPDGRLTPRQTIDKMTSDAYARGGPAAAKQMRKLATDSMRRADRKRK